MNHFLREVENPQALTWAKKWSENTTAALASPQFEETKRRILDVLDSDEKIPLITQRGEYIYNFWKDANHPRGLWRRVPLEDFLTLGQPALDNENSDAGATCTALNPNAANSLAWQVLIDLDALAAKEQENWVWHGAQVRPVAHDRALIRLSRGGADAEVIREFDLESLEFVTTEPFNLPEAKSSVSWHGLNEVLVGTDFGPESLTASGYPVQARRWRRGTKLSEAPILFCGEAKDINVVAWSDPEEGFDRIYVNRALDFFNSETFIDRGNGLELLDVPTDATVSTFREWLLIFSRTDFLNIPAGGLGVIHLDAFMAGSREVHLIFQPDPHTSLQGIHCTKDFLLLSMLSNVHTALSFIRWDQLGQPGVAASHVQLPSDATSYVSSAESTSNRVWLTTQSMTTPPTLCYMDASQSPKPHTLLAAPRPFSGEFETRQHWVTSADGTKVPYFVTGRFTGTPTKTLVYGYGGFEVSLLPVFSAARGISWLERGYLYVQPSLRGGGEFGPSWHEQAIRENRHKVFEDLMAVLDDVVRRGYATRESIGFRGGSNGGLLSAVALTRFPEKFGAAVVQVPLTDMLNYHTMLAGASWVSEYGNPDDPQQRQVLESYSPLHNVVPSKERTYPPALVTTSTRDDRVHPAHARLFAEALQEAGQKVDYFENTEGGHAGAADNKQIAFVETLIAQWLERELH